MARVKSVGELDWAMYGYSDGYFRPACPISLGDTMPFVPKDTYELMFRLLPDHSFELHPNTYEQMDMVGTKPIAFVVNAKGETEWDLQPRCIDERLSGLFFRLSKCIDGLKVHTKEVIKGKTVIWLTFLTDDLPEPPDKYLHRLARQMSRLAKKK